MLACGLGITAWGIGDFSIFVIIVGGLMVFAAWKQIQVKGAAAAPGKNAADKT